jgi:hypothetical protein
VFNLYNNDRLTAWKDFRDTLETSNTPLEDVAEFWSRAPFVSPYLNPNDPTSWPDPWHLVLDSRLDTLAIVLGMLYTIKLTQRFANTKLEVKLVKTSQTKELTYVLVVDNQNVLNLEYKCVVGVNNLENLESNLLWSS